VFSRSKGSLSTRALSARALVALFGVASSVSASTISLPFTSSSGTVHDATGQGIGFTTWLPNTYSTAGNDSDLTLNTSAPSLTINADDNGSDFNGQIAINQLQAPGIDLASLGFTGSQDFSITASFILPNTSAFAHDSNRFGIYVGSASNNLTRAGFINFYGTTYAPYL
jgi:arabinan endo-1,5-alpha-L-arabinosidase